ncbi:hypothetical protein Hanom_Chr11g00983751 [Helianthus anomalus]
MMIYTVRITYKFKHSRRICVSSINLDFYAKRGLKKLNSLNNRKGGEKEKTARKGKELGIRNLEGCIDLQKREKDFSVILMGFDI